MADIEDFALLVKDDLELEDLQNKFDGRFKAFPTFVQKDGRTFRETLIVKLTDEEFDAHEKLIQEGRRANALAIEKGVHPTSLSGHAGLAARQANFNKALQARVADDVKEQGAKLIAIDTARPVERFTVAVTGVGEFKPGDIGSGPVKSIRFEAEDLGVIEEAKIQDAIRGKGRNLKSVTPKQAGEIATGATVTEAVGSEPTAEDVRRGVIAEMDEADRAAGLDPEGDQGPSFEERRAEMRAENEAALEQEKADAEAVRRGQMTPEAQEYRRRRRLRRDKLKRNRAKGFLLDMLFGNPERPGAVTVGEAEDIARAKAIAQAKAGQERLAARGGAAAVAKAADATGDAAKAAKTAAKTAASASKMGGLMRLLGPIGYGFMAYDLLSREPRRRREILDRRLQMNADIMDRIRERTVTKQPSITGEYAAIQDLAQGLPPQQASVRMTPELQAILGSRAQEVARMGTPIAPSFTELMARQGRYQ